MEIYHGSKIIVKTPKYKGSNAFNDYGAAFYATKDLDSAHEWAGRNDTIGVVNKYKINTRGLKILDLTDKNQFNVLTWLAILMHFRNLPIKFRDDFASRLNWLEANYFVNVDEYDLIYGYRADDAYFAFPLEFIRGNLTYENLEEIYKLGNLGKQVVIMSRKAIDRLEFVGHFESKKESVGKYKDRTSGASKTFKEILVSNLDKPGMRIGDLINEHNK